MYKLTVPFTIQPRRRENAALLSLEGELVLGPALTVFNQETRTALAAPAPELLVLNLEKVQRIDSAGLGELILLHTRASAIHTKIALAGATPRVLELLSVTRVDGIFPCYPDERAALESVTEKAQ